MLWPREGGRFISERAKNVQVVPEGVEKVAVMLSESVKEGKMNLKEFLQNDVLPVDKGLTEEQLLNWTFLVDTLNFNFWTPDGEPKYTVRDKGRKRTGYMAMVAAINRAIDEGKKIYDPNYYSKLTLDDIKHIFRSETKSSMPLFDERVRVLGEVGKKLNEEYEGTFLNVLKKADCSALKLVDIVTSEFECFRDVAKYEGQEVAMFKRAQILASDIWVLFKGEGLGAFTDIDKLTIFADYRVPQAMAHFGVLKYSPSLEEKLKKQHIFQSGEQEEVEIRGCSIHAAELIVERMKDLLSQSGCSASINSAKVDFFLWDYRLTNAAALESVPYHRVRCIYY
ncbi:queuosine 5'-phosphate N-glycosylase/hydrolase-like [Penaeus indicus]|uniref:queuosine 5'-phosphate N-glycosylase/hydrolase-like n=1 Tax=Penaeus indicus TaxID=29960 RepID=UPI00300D5651